MLKSDYLQRVYTQVVTRDPDQKEFHQAVLEFLESLDQVDDLPVPLSATRTACPQGSPVPSPSFLFRELQVSTFFIPYQNLLFQEIPVLIPKKFRKKNR